MVVDSLTTPTEQVLALPDGKFSKTVSVEPTRMLANGTWTDISTDLVETGGMLQPKMVPADLKISKGGDSKLSSVSDRRGHTVTESWAYGKLPVAKISGNMATYASVFPGVDLIQVAKKQGISQVLKIYTAEAATDPRVLDFKLKLEATGVNLDSDAKGGLKATSRKTGEDVLQSRAGHWWDSRHRDAGPTDPGGPGTMESFDLSLSNDVGGTHEKLRISDILSRKDLTYPLYIDPDWSTARASYVFVDSAYPTTSYWNGQIAGADLNLGFLPAKWDTAGKNHTAHAYWQFTTSPMVGKKIFAARFNATNFWSSSCVARTVRAKITGGVGTGTTWNSQPGIARDIEAKSFAYGNEGLGCGDATVGFDMMAAADLFPTVSQWTVGLFADGEYSDELSWKRFTNNATITVTYGTAPNTPVLNSISGCGLTCAEYVTRYNQPTINLSASDPDGDAGGTILIWITVRNTAGTAVASTSSGRPVPGSGGSTTWQVPVVLADGTYRLEYQSSDQQGISSAGAATNFTVNTAAPSGPRVLAGDFNMNSDPEFYNKAVVGVTGLSYSVRNLGPYPIKGFVYAVTAGTGIPDYPKSVGALACGQRTGPFVVVCPADGRSANVTVAPVDLTSTFSVWAFDTAGNINTQAESGAVSVTFTVGNMAPAPTKVLPTSVAGGAQWVDVPTNRGTPSPVAGCMLPQATGPATTAYRALRVPAAGAFAKTLQAAVNNAESFSFSGWFCPAKPSAANRQVALSQMNDAGTVGSLLGLSPQHLWELAAYDTATPANLKNVSQDAVEGAATQQWYFIGAIYDRINAQLRLTVSNTKGTKTWVIATAATSHRPSTGASPAVLGTANPATPAADQFTGLIYRPVMTQGVLVNSQFGPAWDRITSAYEGILVK
ncbi:hypothetical protein [Arthrobacter sp. B3I9]|uniref:hypothetical protein n=1 Tax=Arthrobacter sp. B3I9 TaxID=3042270 RepID=UPI0027D76CA0|nr:hypothetical protein [Arthrobacter sp. B3I9]